MCLRWGLLVHHANSNGEMLMTRWKREEHSSLRVAQKCVLFLSHETEQFLIIRYRLQNHFRAQSIAPFCLPSFSLTKTILDLVTLTWVSALRDF